MSGPPPARPFLGGGVGLRVASSLVMAPLALGAVWAGGIIFAAALALCAVLLADEWGRVAEGARGVQDGLRVAGLLLAILLGFGGDWTPAWLCLAATALLGVIAGLLRGGSPAAAFKALAGTAYVGVPVLALLALRLEGVPGLGLMLWLLLVVWAADSAAFAAGRTFGGPKLAPRISPAKTRSGLYGAVAGAALTGALAALAIGLDGSVLAWALGGALTGFGAQVGDLMESAIKRHFGVKDMGSLIPGHGGLFDRLDGLMFVAPPFALALAALGEWQI
ncbi:phosphatidate cytidylyltransferase [Zavarzinia sp. CC-PAN008]|uniref:phosphatidate cytidylyltransferase n=1 Tax=Zavarzinia sp. CC-PAN008 TaxID=3243332 RepID=UPI003F749F94